MALLDHAANQLDSSAPDAALAWLSSLHAVTHAALGDTSNARAVLRTAEKLAERHRGEPRWPWVFAFDATKAARYQASVLGKLGDFRAACSAYDAAGITALAPKPRALAQVEHAGVLARAGTVGEGGALAAEVLRVGRHYGSERITARVRDFRATLPVGTTAAAELDEALTALYEQESW
ncbi:MAG: hypothetical protein ABR608_01890 [Pseudonocardiaceae bacterium]